MKAVLAATVGRKKLYYVLDAESAEDDGVVVNEENKAIRVSFFSFASKMKKLKKMQNTPFHKFLWTEPDGEIKKIWIDTFVLKKRPIGKKFTEKLIIHSQLGEKAKKQKNTEIRVKAFLNKAADSRKTDNILSRIELQNKTIHGEENEF